MRGINETGFPPAELLHADGLLPKSLQKPTNNGKATVTVPASKVEVVVPSPPNDRLPRFEFVSYATDEQRAAGRPARATMGSAGYDFVAPHDIVIEPGEDAIFETGIKIYLPEQTYLSLKVRSSLAYGHGVCLVNEGAVIDSDYADNPKNEGNIVAGLHNAGHDRVIINRGEAYMQGIIQPYLCTYNDYVTAARTGGIGSTNGR